MRGGGRRGFSDPESYGPWSGLPGACPSPWKARTKKKPQRFGAIFFFRFFTTRAQRAFLADDLAQIWTTSIKTIPGNKKKGLDFRLNP